MKEVGLVLEGGGMRSVYVAGVLDAFLDHGIRFTDCVAVSDGVLNAASYLPGQRTRAYKAYTKFLSILNNREKEPLSHSGADFLYREVAEELVPLDYSGFRKEPYHLTAVLTNCNTGKAEYKKIRDLWSERKVLRAAVAIPPISQMVAVDGTPYFDGSIANPIPVHYALKHCFSRAVVILTKEAKYRRHPSHSLPMYRFKYRKFPALLGAMNYRHIRYNRTLSHLQQWEAEGRVFLIRPQTEVKLSRFSHSREELSALYNAGVRDGVLALPALRAFLQAARLHPLS